jgi:hypothetical protein
VKNFTNFACGCCGGPIKFWAIKTERFPLPVRVGVDRSPVFAQKKQLTVSSF